MIQEDDQPTLHLITAILLYDGRSHDETFEMMQQEGAFARLVELLQSMTAEAYSDRSLHSLLMGLLYEMSRIQRLTWEDLSSVNDAFILYLFQLIEGLSDDANDPYHYAVIRCLLVLNEQYMVISATGTPLTNRVLKALSSHGNSYKTFGENLILLLNRESETSLQLLILKLLYLLFSSSSTAEYFYTNDLHVLLDVILRNLLDLPGPLEDGGKSTGALRHTYLRVLHPLLANSQLKRPGMGYKRDEIRKILRLLGSEHKERENENENGDRNTHSFAHFAPIDATTLRLVRRCAAVDWLRESIEPGETTSPILTITPASSFPTPTPGGSGKGTANGTAEATASEGEGQKEVARHLLGMSAPNGGESALSVLEVAAQTEKPGVLSPSRQRAGLGLEMGEGDGGDQGGGKEAASG